MSILGLKRALCSAVSLVAVSFSWSQVNAQETNAEKSAGADAAYGLEEIFITATKRSESLQDVPIAITAFGATQLERLRPSNLIDLSGAVPNMLMVPAGGSGRNSVSIRGLGGGIGRSSGGAVGIYIDGVYQGFSETLNAIMADIERVEVLKGPQGTLFGRDTIGGAINITTKKPGNEFSGHAAIEYGNLNHVKLTAGIDIPLVEDVLVARISGQREWEDGYVFNQFDGQTDIGAKDQFSGRAQLYFTPNDQFSARLTFTHLETDDTPYTGEPINNFQGDTVPYFTNVNGTYARKLNADALSLTMEYEANSGYVFTSISSYSNSKDFSTQDTDYTTQAHLFETFRGNGDEYSQELRLTSPTGKAFDFIVGGYYFKNVNDKIDVYDIDEASYSVSLGFPAGFPFPPTIEPGQERDFTTKTVAAFANANYHISDELTVFAGLRLTSEKKETTYSIFGSFTPFIGFPNIEDFVSKTSDSPLSWTVGARYKLTEDFMVYGTVARGYRSGAIKDYFVTPADIAAETGFFTKPEFVTNYEVGFKADAFDNRLQANFAAFYMDYTDIIAAIATNGSFTSVLVNATTASVKGFELDVKAQLSDTLLWSASAGYLKSSYGDFQPTPDLDLTGEPLGNFPDWSLSSSLDYSLPLSNDGTFTAHADLAYKGVYATTPGEGLERREIGGYVKANAALGYVAPEEVWSVTLWVENLFDVDDAQRGNNWNAGQGFFNDHFVVTYEHPRTYGLTLATRF